MRWSIYREHPNIVAIRDFLPERPGPEVYYVVESSPHAGAYMVDARSGKVIWKANREDDPRWTHGHIGWAADIFAGAPGPECYANRDGHLAKETVLFAADGRILSEAFPNTWTPVEWDGDEGRELIGKNGLSVGRFDGSTVVPLEGAAPNETGKGSVVMVADIVGDFRDEVVVVGPNNAGNLTVSIFSPVKLIPKRAVTRTARHDYRMWLAHKLTGGYRSYFESVEP